MTLERTGGQILVDQLAAHGVEHAFCVPGESYLAVLDALHDSSIALTVCRQEGGAAMMAEASAKLTGKPGICFVTRGPGASNAFPGLHIAQQDSTPMLLFVGQVERSALGRDAFQELDYVAVFSSVAKWVVEITDAARIPELVSRAFHVAASGRPGPVVISLPEDMLTDTAMVPDASPTPASDAYPSPSQWEAFARLLKDAERPVAILGGSRWSAEAVRQFEAFAARAQIPVYCSFRRQMLFNADHECYGGDLGLGANPDLLASIKGADLLLLIGGRLSEIPSQGYTLLDIPQPRQKLVHVLPGAEEIGKLYHPTLGIVASPASFAAGLGDLDLPAPSNSRHQRCADAHSSYVRWSDPKAVRVPGDLQMGEIMAQLRETAPADAIFCNGAGNYATWLHRFWPFRSYATQLAPTSGSMGYCIPSAVGAKRIAPEKTVIAFAGDGCFLMNGQEFATAVQYALPIIVILIDNGMYGTIRMHQERHYPGRVSGTDLKNPDFAAYARAFGGEGETIERTDEFLPAFQRALKSRVPTILHCKLSPEAITPTTTLTALREASSR
ncbi:acetolactate synthase-1/2/3 large subunit [Rhodoligotrophos appendicifer]|uniref:thiamine pyrophosphate-binding protein n=1 Tax=Rhodoligotrophos appendicifer TaxID=987056 RepID=UPI00117DA574|nr:thiamine pyrophosphate-binding protein [Rhodoligotrophos appendicifer]